jgi:ubiquinone/menaquinone biosynthesis C-methylase UbiE
MPDQIFANPRLAAIYDAFDGKRGDLDHYVAIAQELNAKSILDVGCGTGSFACLLAQHGFSAIGVDPADASLDMARRKPYANHVRWISGNTTNLPPLSVDLVAMTGNVAQVFLTDEDWTKNLSSIHQTLRPNGYLVFEVRDPSQKAWLKWTKEQTHQRLQVPDIGFVEGWCDVINVSEAFVSFRWTYTFESDGSVLASDSTLCFRSKYEIVNSLEKTGYKVNDIREAPDRPKQEFVFIAQCSDLH